MTRNRIEIEARPEDVFAVLLDPTSYAYWVVGSKDIRAVDREWPAPGSAFHHAIGTEAADVKDKTEILEVNRPERLRLRAYLRPLGIADVTLSITAKGDRSQVTIEEWPAEGTKANKVAPLLSPLIFARNFWSLRRLRKLVLGRREG